MPPSHPETTRFAPSPSGALHLGHAYAAWFAWDCARRSGGRFLLRLEDLDAGRCQERYAAAIEQELLWLGLDWQTPVLRQSTRHAAYESAMDQLRGLGVVYPCFCTRRDIQE